MPRKGIEIGHAALDVIEREPARVHLLQERFDRIDGFFVTRGGRRFAQAHGAVGASQFDDDGGKNICATAAGDGPGMGKMQIEPPEVEFHGQDKSLIRGETQ